MTLFSSFISENWGNFAVSRMATCAMHPAGLSPMFTLTTAESSISSSGESLHRNRCTWTSRSSSHTELYILVMSPMAACSPSRNLRSTPLIGFRTSGPLSKMPFMLTPLNSWLLFQTRRTGVVTEWGFGAVRWLTHHTAPSQLSITSLVSLTAAPLSTISCTCLM